MDGTDAGAYQVQPYMALESGILSESVFEDIANAKYQAVDVMPGCSNLVTITVVELHVGVHVAEAGECLALHDLEVLNKVLTW